MPLSESGVPFYPDLLHLALPADHVARIAYRANVVLTRRYQEQLGARFPSLKSILNATLLHGASGALFEPENTDRLDLPSQGWKPYNESRPGETGLYRRKSRHGPPEYVLAAEGSTGTMEVFHVPASEWVFVAAMAKLRVTLTLRYNRATRRLTVPRRFHGEALLPTLVERLLRSGTLLNPSPTGDSFGYGGITVPTVERLRALFPFATVEDSE